MRPTLTIGVLSIIIITSAVPIGAFFATISHVGTTAATMTGFTGSAFNSSTWRVFHNGNGPSIAASAQNLVITIPANSTDDPVSGGFAAGVVTTCPLSGDFDFQVGFHLLVWPSQNGVRVGMGPSLAVPGGSSTPFAVERDSLSASESQPGEYYLTHMIDGINGVTPASGLSGYIRLTRVGSSATGYYLNGSQWISIHTGPVVSSDVKFALAAWSQAPAFAHQLEQISYANFTLTSGTERCPSLIVNPTSGPAGTKVTIQGSGFPVSPTPTFPTVSVSFDDNFIGTTTNNAGAFLFTLDVPLAQPGTHLIKASDSSSGANASAVFQVTLPPTGPSVVITTGTVYFPGDKAVAMVLVTAAGIPLSSTGLTLIVTLTKPDNSNTALNVTSMGSGLYMTSYSIPKLAVIGTYTIEATVHLQGAGDGSAISSFEVRLPWLSSQAQATIVGGGIATAGVAGVAFVSWRKGFFRKSSNSSF